MKKLSVSLACLAWFACTPNIPVEEPPRVIVARFDPSAVPAIVPSPNDLATNPATGLLAVPVPANASAVDKEFYAYLNTLNGFPLSSTAATTFDGELAENSVTADTVKVYNVTENHAVVTPSAITYVRTGDANVPARINVSPPVGGWKAGNTYAIAVIGGDKGVKAADGVRKVVGSATWAFLRSVGPLVTCEADGGNCRASTEIIPSAVKDDAARRLADQTGSARRLEGLRLKYKPTLDVLVASGVARSDVAILWSFKANAFTLLQFNPAAVPPKVPTPNDLAIDRTTGLVKAPIDPASSAAQQEFTAEYLNTLNGFPVSATGTAEVVGGDLDPATITSDTVFVVPLKGGDLAGDPIISYDAATKTLRIAPFGGSWGKSRSLALVVVGGKNGVKRVGGGTVVGTETWALTRSKNPLVNCTDLTSAECRAVITAAPLSTAQAIALEALRRGYAPVLDLLHNDIGVPREEIALMWVFRTVDQPEATFDPAQSIIPFPNNLLINPMTGRLNLPVPATPGLQQQLVQGLNTLDGFSLTAPIVSENSDTRGALDLDKIDAVSLDGGTTGFVKLPGGPGPLLPKVIACLNCASSKLADGGTGVFFPDGGSIEPAPQQLQFVPQLPLEEKTNYAGWLTTGLKDTKGRPVMAAPAFALLRSKATLLDAGKSTINGVSDAQAAALEPVRLGLKPMFDALEAGGKLRKDLALAFSFKTQSTVSVLQQLNALPAALPVSTALPTSVNNVTALLPAPVIAQLANVAKVFQAQVPLPFILTGPGGTLNPPVAALPQFRHAPMLITIPTGVPPAGGFPVLVFGHGLTSNRTAMIAFANTAAGAGFATVAIDVVYHGERTSCVGSLAATMQVTDDAACANPVNQQCDPTTGRCIARASFTPSACVFGADGPTGDLGCQAQGQGLCLSTNSCEGGDFNRVDPNSPPRIAAWNFLNLTNLFATRDNFRNAPVDFAMLVKILRVPAATTGSLAARLAAIDPNAVLNTSTSTTTTVNYAGQSLGGINGAMASAVNADFKHIGLNVPGADQVQVLLTAPGFAAQRAGFLGNLASLGLRPGMPAFDQFMVLAKTILDPADPQNAIWTGVNQSMPAGRRVYIQYIENDVVIPNPTTILLINAANQTPANQSRLTFTQPAAGFPAAARHSYLLACPGDSTGSPLPECQVERVKAQTQMATFLVTGTQPAP